MRVISQDGTIDIPYDQVVIQRFEKLVNEMLRNAYAGRFVTNGDIPDDFDEQLKELMKMGFGTVIAKETNESRVEFNNLNGYFQFPKDEDVEV